MNKLLMLPMLLCIVIFIFSQSFDQAVQSNQLKPLKRQSILYGIVLVDIQMYRYFLN